MKTFLLVVCMFFCGSVIVIANQLSISQQSSANTAVAKCDIQAPQTLDIMSMVTDHQRYVSEYIIVAQRGCCSWHGGVCGCKNGRVVCCDNTYSPSCRCGG